MTAFLLGLMFGLTITISIGPGSIALFQTSLVRGLSAGFVFATGMLISDLLLILLSYFGLSELLLKWDFKVMGIIAGIILIIIGGVTLFKSSPISWDSTKTNPLMGNWTMLLVKGFFLNIANPFSLIFWIGIVGFAARNWGLHSQNLFLFFLGVFVTAFSTDLLKCYLSELLSKVLTSKTIHWINKSMGLVFIGIGFFLIYKVQ